MDWKASLDRYLTTPPSDEFGDWCEQVVECHTPSFYDLNEDWINEYDGQCNKWLNKLSIKDKTPQQAALIIERSFNIYLKKQ